MTHQDRYADQFLFELSDMQHCLNMAVEFYEKGDLSAAMGWYEVAVELMPVSIPQYAALEQSVRRLHEAVRCDLAKRSNTE